MFSLKVSDAADEVMSLVMEDEVIGSVFLSTSDEPIPRVETKKIMTVIDLRRLVGFLRENIEVPIDLVKVCTPVLEDNGGVGRYGIFVQECPHDHYWIAHVTPIRALVPENMKIWFNDALRINTLDALLSAVDYLLEANRYGAAVDKALTIWRDGGSPLTASWSDANEEILKALHSPSQHYWEVRKPGQSVDDEWEPYASLVSAISAAIPQWREIGLTSLQAAQICFSAGLVLSTDMEIEMEEAL